MLDPVWAEVIVGGVKINDVRVTSYDHGILKIEFALDRAEQIEMTKTLFKMTSERGVYTIDHPLCRLCRVDRVVFVSYALNMNADGSNATCTVEAEPALPHMLHKHSVFSTIMKLIVGSHPTVEKVRAIFDEADCPQWLRDCLGPDYDLAARNFMDLMSRPYNSEGQRQ